MEARAPADLTPACRRGAQLRPHAPPWPRPRRALGRAPVRARRDPLVAPTRAVQAAIAERLGWLDAPDHFTERDRRPRGLRRGDPRRRLHDRGRRRDGRQQPRPGRPPPDVRRRSRAGSPLRILDSTDPAAVAATRRRPRPARDAVHRRDQVRHDDRAAGVPGRRVGAGRARRSRRRDARGPAPGEFIVAITDPGGASRRSRTTTSFREVFLNPPDIGGRYSALTYVGLVPAVADRARPRRRSSASAPAMLGALPRARTRRPTPACALGLAHRDAGARPAATS